MKNDISLHEQRITAITTKSPSQQSKADSPESGLTYKETVFIGTAAVMFHCYRIIRPSIETLKYAQSQSEEVKVCHESHSVSFILLHKFCHTELREHDQVLSVALWASDARCAVPSLFLVHPALQTRLVNPLSGTTATARTHPLRRPVVLVCGETHPTTPGTNTRTSSALNDNPLPSCVRVPENLSVRVCVSSVKEKHFKAS